MSELAELSKKMGAEFDTIRQKSPLFKVENKVKAFNDMLPTDKFSNNSIKTILSHGLSDGNEIKFSGNDATFYVKVVNDKEFRVFSNINDINDVSKAIRFNTPTQPPVVEPPVVDDGGVYLNINPDTTLIYKSSIRTNVSYNSDIQITDEFKDLRTQFDDLISSMKKRWN